MIFSVRTHFLFIILLIFCVQNGTCVKCYNCSQTQRCSQEFFTGKGIAKIDCPDNVPCQKVKHPSIGGDIEPITRGCYNEELCDNLSVCFKCKSDLCNSSIGVGSSFMVVLVSTMVCIWNNL